MMYLKTLTLISSLPLILGLTLLVNVERAHAGEIRHLWCGDGTVLWTYILNTYKNSTGQTCRTYSYGCLSADGQMYDGTDTVCTYS